MHPPPAHPAVDRVFLGWDGPALPAACGWLWPSAADGVADLSGLAVVVPGARAGRLLLAMLVERARHEGVALVPPEFYTPGEVVELMLGPLGVPAGPVTRRLAWIEALRSTPAAVLAPFLPRPPAADDWPGWSAAASFIQSCHDELAGQLMTFDELPSRARAAAPGFAEDDRWLAAAAAQRRYEQVLASAGLIDPALARLRAIRSDRPALPRRVVLVGVLELNEAARRALAGAPPPAPLPEGGDGGGLPGLPPTQSLLWPRSQLSLWPLSEPPPAPSPQPAAVTALIFAPRDLADGFDSLGCVAWRFWENRPVGLDDAQLVYADEPNDQADRALAAIAGLCGRFAPHEVVIGVPDPDVTPAIRRRAELYGGLEVRAAAGRPAVATPPFRLLHAIERLLRTRSFDALADFVRHPDVERALAPDAAGGREDWLNDLDRYLATHRPGRIDLSGQVRRRAAGRSGVARSSGTVRVLVRKVLALLSDLWTERREPAPGPESAPALRPLADWAPAIPAVLRRVYQGRELNLRVPRDRRLAEALRMIREIADEIAALPAGAAALRVAMSAAQAVAFLLDQCAARTIPDEPSGEAVELLGWLELLTDPARAAIVTGLNEGAVPEPVGSASWLPESLREALGVPGRRARFGRDVYVLSHLVRSRERVALIAGRRSAAGDPLRPSRLLFTDDADRVVERVRRFVGGGEPRVVFARRLSPGAVSGFPVAPRIDAPLPASLPVTSLRAYIASPYVFYLRYVLRLKAIEAPPPDLDPAAIGEMMHKALEQFGLGPAGDSADRHAIAECLIDEFDAEVSRRLGGRPRPMVTVQLEFARERLASFARLQAERRAAGWRIEHAEWKPASPVALPGAPADAPRLMGKIDRIDRHEVTGAVAILDYKTGDRPFTPEESHHRPRSRKWIDLQLPLYRHLAAELGLPADPAKLELGFALLPRDAEGAEFCMAAWSQSELASADAAANAVLRGVVAGRFGEIGTPRDREEVWSALCGLGMLGVEAQDAPDAGGDSAIAAGPASGDGS